eukprot:CAMPEP_0202458306 /NCGR_PEP_ID=MMETSP1360-20130828/24455_1 /ASSEMBLY_ACC=CAM_ASM_000848 /TAXON_ID=515479 /ORGANISM="Licmophora paradoxa, Strain CCMP2313" /LENGTH=165 /DNA_ID=CAMNT_0049078797 /DNA_START=57 /DNA_END=554 /DNA_ORIENTATION=-
MTSKTTSPNNGASKRRRSASIPISKSVRISNQFGWYYQEDSYEEESSQLDKDYYKGATVRMYNRILSARLIACQGLLARLEAENMASSDPSSKPYEIVFRTEPPSSSGVLIIMNKKSKGRRRSSKSSKSSSSSKRSRKQEKKIPQAVDGSDLLHLDEDMIFELEM